MSSVIRRFAVQQPDKGQSDPEEVGEIPPYLYYGKTHRIPRALLEAANEEAWAALEATVDPKAFIRPVDEMEPVPNGILERYEVFDVDTGDMLIMYRFPFRIKGH